MSFLIVKIHIFLLFSLLYFIILSKLINYVNIISK